MAIIHYAVCGINVWELGSTLNYINILKPVYFNVFCMVTFYSVLIKEDNYQLPIDLLIENKTQSIYER